MAYIPSRPIVADDPLAYFAALNAPKHVAKVTLRQTPPTLPAKRALDLMYGYYIAE